MRIPEDIDYFSIGNSTTREIIHSIAKDNFRSLNESSIDTISYLAFKWLEPVGLGYDELWVMRVDEVAKNCLMDYILDFYKKISNCSQRPQKVEDLIEMEKGFTPSQKARVNGEIYRTFKDIDRAREIYTLHDSSWVCEELSHSFGLKHPKNDGEKLREFFLDFVEMKTPKIITIDIEDVNKIKI